jgi:hypothetical protein
MRCLTMKFWFTKYTSVYLMKLSLYAWVVALLVTIAPSVFGFTEDSNDNKPFVSSLVLNGKPLDYAHFSVISKGKLSLIKGNPYALESSTKIPFRIYLKRGHEYLNAGLSSTTREVHEVEIAHILDLARFGDELIIEPIHKNHPPKHTIKLTRYFVNDIFRPLFWKNKTGDGC